MNELHLPWIEAAVLVPLIGAAWVSRIRDPEFARRQSLWFAGLALACTVGAWVDFALGDASAVPDRWNLAEMFFGTDWFVLDHLSAPLRQALPATIAQEVEMHAVTFAQPEVKARIATLFGA